MGNRRVFVQGSGAICSLGVGRVPFLDAIFRGESGVGPFQRLSPKEGPEDGPEEGAEKCVAGAVAAGWADAERIARAVIEEAGEADAMILATTKADLSGVVGEGAGEGVPYRLLRRLHSRDGPSAAVSCACASGLAALALAGRWIRSGHADEVIVVGVDILTGFVLDGFRGLLALDDSPCRPYDASREGLNLGEGAAAIRVGTTPSEIEVIGWGESNDATHVTAPARDGAGLARAAQLALDRAGLAADEIDLVHGHGTGTPFNDAMEGQAILRAFGQTPPPLCGSKGQIGHTLGAAGVLESMIAMEALRRGTAPANVRLETTDLDAAVVLPREPMALPRSRTAMKWAAGFGGINAAVIFQIA